MSNLLRIVMLTAGLLAPSFVAGQQDTGIPQSPPAKLDGKFAIVHMEKDDRTVVALPHQKVGGEKSCGIWVTAGYTYLGKATAPPERAYISFVRDSADEPKVLKSEADRMLVLSVDGEILRLGPMPSVKEVVTGYSLVTQGLLLPIPYETFSKIANAKKVGVQLGPLEFSLTEKNLQDFRDLQHRMKP